MLLAAVVLGTGPVSISAAVPRTRERHAAVQPQRYPVPLNDVRITGGPFLHAQEMDRRWLDAMDPDRYLSGFRSEAGARTQGTPLRRLGERRMFGPRVRAFSVGGRDDVRRNRRSGAAR